MTEEHRPTRKMQEPETGDERSPHARPQHQPTVPMRDAGASHREHYGPAAAQPGSKKTVRLKKEPPAFAWLVMTEGIHAGHIFRLHPDVTLVGRDPSCDIVVDDPAVSRQHVKLRVAEDEDKQKAFVIHDLATENGTFVNDEQIVKHELSDGDRVLIGETKLVFKQIRV